MNTQLPAQLESEGAPEDESELVASYIEMARERHVIASDNKIEIDSDARVSFANDGAWVAAWVWVARPDALDEV